MAKVCTHALQSIAPIRTVQKFHQGTGIISANVTPAYEFSIPIRLRFDIKIGNIKNNNSVIKYVDSIKDTCNQHHKFKAHK